jgi:hypothetical protein
MSLAEGRGQGPGADRGHLLGKARSRGWFGALVFVEFFNAAAAPLLPTQRPTSVRAEPCGHVRSIDSREADSRIAADVLEIRP